MRSWWEIRHLPNVLFVHFTDLKAAPETEIRRIANFLEIDPSEATWPAILEHCSFEYMQAHAAQSVPLGGAFWEGGAKTFLNKGTNGRWQSELTPELSRAYEARAEAELGEACARWLAAGGSV